MRIGTHALAAAWRKCRNTGDRCAVLVEQLLRTIALQPRLKLLNVLRVVGKPGERYLV